LVLQQPIGQATAESGDGRAGIKQQQVTSEMASKDRLGVCTPCKATRLAQLTKRIATKKSLQFSLRQQKQYLFEFFLRQPWRRRQDLFDSFSINPCVVDRL
jgi:hypothetical protein